MLMKGDFSRACLIHRWVLGWASCKYTSCIKVTRNLGLIDIFRPNIFFSSIYLFILKPTSKKNKY